MKWVKSKGQGIAQFGNVWEGLGTKN
jgi:hypothetical protein